MKKEIRFTLKLQDPGSSPKFRCDAPPEIGFKFEYESVESAEQDFASKGFTIVSKNPFGEETLVHYLVTREQKLPNTILIKESEVNDSENLKK